MHIRTLVTAAVALTLTACGSDSPSGPSTPYTDYVVSIAGETFVIRTADPETRRLAEENLQGKSSAFPSGPVLNGNGGFNAPWSWHVDPAKVRFVENTIELCDGRPSEVENNRARYPTYCPWGAKVVAIRTPAQ